MSKCKSVIGMAIALSSLFIIIGLIAVPHLFAKDVVNSPFLPDSIVRQRVDSVMQTLSTREKIAQLIIIEYCSEDKPEKRAVQEYLISKEKVGGIILMWDKLPFGIERTNELHNLAEIPLLTTIDAEWGVSMRYRELPVFPRQMQFGAIADESVIYKAGYHIGKECADFKYHVNFASDVDVNNNADNPVINTRSFGEDMHKVASYGAAFIKGMNDAGVYGSAKHFPGHGDTNVDSHKALPTLDFSYDRLDSLELYPFKQLISQSVDMIMVAHLSVPALDSTGTPTSISKPVVTDLLKGKLGYKGIVITDALNMKGVSESLEKKMIALEAYKAGVDILLMPEDVSNSITEIEKALDRGEITMASLDERVRKVLTLKAKAGLFEKGYSPYVDPQAAKDSALKVENKAFIYEVAKESMTLVTNFNGKDGEPVLPVKQLKGKKIAYLGYDAAKGGKECAAVLRRFAAVDSIILRGPVKLSDLEKAKRDLASYDLLILGINNTDARPQFNFGIDSVQMKFITDWAVEQDMVALFMGTPYVLDRLKDYENFKAFIIGYQNIPQNLEAVAQIIFGAVPAKGVLPVSSDKFKYGYSLKLDQKIRPEFIPYSKDNTYRMKGGKIYGNHILKCEGDTLWFNEPIRLSGSFLDEFIGKELFEPEASQTLADFFESMGMADTRAVEENGRLAVTTTLDDMSKFWRLMMGSGEFGGIQQIPEPVRDRFILVIYSIMKRDNGMKVSDDGLKIWVDADVHDIVYKYQTD